MLKQIYLALQALLWRNPWEQDTFDYVLPVIWTSDGQLGGLVMHYDWYNRNERAPDGEDRSLPYLTPAALVEFAPVVWQALSGRIQQAPLRFTIHLVQERVNEKQADNPLQSQALQHLDLVDQVVERLTGSSATININNQDQMLYNGIRLVTSVTDHNADSRYVTQLTFECTIFDYLTRVKYVPYLIPNNQADGLLCPLPLEE